MTEYWENYKMTPGAIILTVYGIILIVVLSYLHITSTEVNIVVFALIIASYPIMGIILTLLEEAIRSGRRKIYR